MKGSLRLQVQLDFNDVQRENLRAARGEGSGKKHLYRYRWPIGGFLVPVGKKVVSFACSVMRVAAKEKIFRWKRKESWQSIWIP